MSNGNHRKTRITALFTIIALIGALLFSTVSTPAFADQSATTEESLIENWLFVCSLKEFKDLVDASDRNLKTEYHPSNSGEDSLVIERADSKAGVLFMFTKDEEAVEEGYDTAVITQLTESDHEALLDLYADIITILDPSVDKDSVYSYLVETDRAETEKDSSLMFSTKELGSLSLIISQSSAGNSMIVINPAGIKKSSDSLMPETGSGLESKSDSSAQERHYQALISAYRDEEYEEALDEYMSVVGYKYADRYFDLIRAKFCSALELTDEEIEELEKELLSWIDFEDASKALVYNPDMAEVYLRGFWRSSGNIVYTLEWEDTWYTTLPVVPYSGNYAYIYEGTYWRHDGNVENSVAQFDLIPVSEKELDVYCHQTKGIIRLNKVR